MTDYQKLEHIYYEQGHIVFMMALSILTQVGATGLKSNPETVIIPGNLFTEDSKFQVIQAANTMADCPLDVLLAVVQRILPAFKDPKGIRIPYEHLYGDEEGICPVCGGELKYDGDQVIMDNGTIVSWECESCGATGKEGSDIVFQRHFAVTGANGKPVSGRGKL